MSNPLIIDDAYGRLALAYYRRFNSEPFSDSLTMVLDDPLPIPHTSLATTLQTITQSWRASGHTGNDLLLVSHGNERGLTMRLFPAHRTDARTESLKILMSRSLSRANIAKQLFLTAAQLDSLLDKMSQVRALHLQNVEFRGCNIGKDVNNLTTLRDFLGAKQVGGPDVLSTYGFVNPTIARNSAQFDRWQRTHPTAIIATLNSGRVSLHIVHGAGNSTTNWLIADSGEAITDWLRAFMSASAPFQFQAWMLHNLPIHFLLTAPPILPCGGGFANPFVAQPSPDYVRHIKRTM